jgi:hypothetical protein
MPLQISQVAVLPAFYGEAEGLAEICKAATPSELCRLYDTESATRRDVSQKTSRLEQVCHAVGTDILSARNDVEKI